YLAATIDRAQSTNEQFAVLCLDLDCFKLVNDLYGHAAGDALLQELARRMQITAEGAFIARFGGDEFTIVLQGAAQETAERIAAQLLKAVDEDLNVDGNSLRTGVSVGIAIFPIHGRDAASLLNNADAALYHVKAEGRGSVQVFCAEIGTRLCQRRALAHELQSAITNNELELHYQPQVGTDGEVVGFEALVRWYHPVRGMISPAEFIPLAEENRLIGAIGEWVLREACNEAADWPRPLNIAVNLSPLQFQQGDLASLVQTIL